MINSMDSHMERIVLVESDPQVSQLIADQTLCPLGYQVDVIASASPLIGDFWKYSPDLIITNLHIPGISGKDLMVALTAQGINVPFIVITPKGHESDALQAFRLGAVNFLSTPIREAELVNVVEDTLRQLRRRNELEYYSHQLDQTKAGMERRVRDFIEIFSISKLVSSIANQQLIYEKITNAALQVTEADTAWMLVLDLKKEKYILRACLNTDDEMHSRLQLPYEDGLSSIVALSGQVVSIHGEALKRFNLPVWVDSVLVVPIKKKEQVTGMLAVARKTSLVFNKEQQSMLEMIAEYSSILLENALRFQMLEQRLGYLQQSGIHATIDSDIKNDLLLQASRELHRPLSILMENLDILSSQGSQQISSKQASALNIIQEEAEILVDIADSMKSTHQRSPSRPMEEVDLNLVLRNVVNRFQPYAQAYHIILKLEVPSQPTRITVFATQIIHVIEGIISNALKYSPEKSQIVISIEIKEDRAWLKVNNQVEETNENLPEGMFDKNTVQHAGEARRFCCIGLSLPMMKEIISAHRGEMWNESEPGKGFTIAFSLPHNMEHSG
jgi:K+-sensing histidine kinase KdpD/ActR/RegA family two-component response regulator